MTRNQQSKPRNEHGHQNQEPKKGQNPNDPQNRVENPKHQEYHDENQHRGDKQPTRWGQSILQEEPLKIHGDPLDTSPAQRQTTVAKPKRKIKER